MFRAVILIFCLVVLQACTSVENQTADEFGMIPAEELEAIRHSLEHPELADPASAASGILSNISIGPDSQVHVSLPDSGASAEQETVPDDLLSRIASQFTWPTRAENPRVARYIDQYRSDPELFFVILSRSEPYLYYVERRLREEGLPAELAFLPFVESGYNPIAKSSSSALGLWQFMPATGRQYGLENNWWYDGRADLIDSTDAAINYLGYLHNLFGGNWELALAAYNAGEGFLGRKIQASGRQDYWSLDLYTETENYIPKLLAIVEIIGNPAKYSMTLPVIEDRPQFRVVEIDSQIDLNKAAELADLSRQELVAYNPGFKRWATPPVDTTRLLIPMESADQFSHELSQLPASLRVSFQQYRIQSGDNLGSIALRYGTTVQALMAANNMSNTFIRAGRDLLIPYAGESGGMDRNAPRAMGNRTYVVRSGDSLWEISRSHGVTLDDLIAWNQLSKNSVIRPGQTLSLSTPYDSSGAAELTYQVRNGDSLYEIARRFEVSVAQLQQWNNISTDQFIHPGQLLKVVLTR